MQRSQSIAMVFSDLFDDATTLAAELRLRAPGDPPIIKGSGPNYHSLIHKFRQIFAFEATPTMDLPTSHYILLASIPFVAISHHAAAAPVEAEPQQSMPRPVYNHRAIHPDYKDYTCNYEIRLY